MSLLLGVGSGVAATVGIIPAVIFISAAASAAWGAYRLPGLCAVGTTAVAIALQFRRTYPHAQQENAA